MYIGTDRTVLGSGKEEIRQEECISQMMSLSGSALIFTAPCIH